MAPGGACSGAGPLAVLAVALLVARASAQVCPVDTTRLDLSALKEECAPEVGDPCRRCVCAIGNVLTDAGYDVSGSGAVPFEECAKENVALLVRSGVTIPVLITLSQCDLDTVPECIRPPGTTDAEGANATSATNATNATDAETATPRNATGVSPSNATLDIGNLSAVGRREDDQGNDTRGLDLHSHRSRRVTRSWETAVLAVGLVIALLGATIGCVWCVATRERRRRAARLARRAQHVSFHAESISFTGVTCTLRPPSPPWWSRVAGRRAPAAEPRVLLKGVSGRALRFQLMAIIGPSGSGKSTLLSVLAGEDLGERVTVCGHVMLDDEPRGAIFRRLVAFVPQDDHLLPHLTVRESVTYSARLRLPWYTTRTEATVRVERALEELGLLHVANTMVGQAGARRGVSGGERRRVTIGMELVTEPRVLLLDEPTSGLDSFIAAQVMGTLRSLADAGRIVVASVHQPSSKVFASLDAVLLVVGGRAVWCGAGQHAADTVARAGFPCLLGTNIAEHLLEIASSPRQFSSFEKALSPSEAGEGSRRTSPEYGSEPAADGAVSFSQLQPLARDEYSRSPLNEGAVLLWRTAAIAVRSPSQALVHVVVGVVMGVLLGVLYLDVPDDLAGFQNRMGAFFFSLTFFGLSSLSCIDLFMGERVVYQREVKGAYYGALAYFVPKVVLDFALLRAGPVALYLVVLYPLMGLKAGVAPFFVALATLVLFVGAASALNMCASMVAPSVSLANLLATSTHMLMLLYGGFLVNISSIPLALRWIRWLSPYYYAFEVLLCNEMSGDREFIFNAEVDGDLVEVPVRGQVYLDTLDMHPSSIGHDVSALGVMYCALVGLAFALLVMVRTPRTAARPVGAAAAGGTPASLELVELRSE